MALTERNKTLCYEPNKLYIALVHIALKASSPVIHAIWDRVSARRIDIRCTIPIARVRTVVNFVSGMV